VSAGNLRELALARMGHLGLKCRDVRTREAGIQDIHHQVPQSWAHRTCAAASSSMPKLWVEPVLLLIVRHTAHLASHIVCSM
jgi:hypothetical protein